MKKNFVKYLILFVFALYPCVMLFTACKGAGGMDSSIYTSIASETESASMDSEKDGGSYFWDETSEESSSEEAYSASLEEEESASASIEEDNGFHDDFEEGDVQGNPKGA